MAQPTLDAQDAVAFGLTFQPFKDATFSGGGLQLTTASVSMPDVVFDWTPAPGWTAEQQGDTMHMSVAGPGAALEQVLTGLTATGLGGPQTLSVSASQPNRLAGSPTATTSISQDGMTTVGVGENGNALATTYITGAPQVYDTRQVSSGVGRTCYTSGVSLAFSSRSIETDAFAPVYFDGNTSVSWPNRPTVGTKDACEIVSLTDTGGNVFGYLSQNKTVYYNNLTANNDTDGFNGQPFPQSFLNLSAQVSGTLRLFPYRGDAFIGYDDSGETEDGTGYKRFWVLGGDGSSQEYQVAGPTVAFGSLDCYFSGQPLSDSFGLFALTSNGLFQIQGDEAHVNCQWLRVHGQIGAPLGVITMGQLARGEFAACAFSDRGGELYSATLDTSENQLVFRKSALIAERSDTPQGVGVSWDGAFGYVSLAARAAYGKSASADRTLGTTTRLHNEAIITGDSVVRVPEPEADALSTLDIQTGAFPVTYVEVTHSEPILPQDGWNVETLPNTETVQCRRVSAMSGSALPRVTSLGGHTEYLCGLAGLSELDLGRPLVTPRYPADGEPYVLFGSGTELCRANVSGKGAPEVLVLYDFESPVLGVWPLNRSVAAVWTTDAKLQWYFEGTILDSALALDANSDVQCLPLPSVNSLLVTVYDTSSDQTFWYVWLAGNLINQTATSAPIVRPVWVADRKSVVALTRDYTAVVQYVVDTETLTQLTVTVGAEGLPTQDVTFGSAYSSVSVGHLYALNANGVICHGLQDNTPWTLYATIDASLTIAGNPVAVEQGVWVGGGSSPTVFAFDAEETKVVPRSQPVAGGATEVFQGGLGNDCTLVTGGRLGTYGMPGSFQQLVLLGEPDIPTPTSPFPSLPKASSDTTVPWGAILGLVAALLIGVTLGLLYKDSLNKWWRGLKEKR